MIESNLKTSFLNTIIKGSFTTIFLRILMIVSGYIFLYVLSNNYGISEVGNFTLIQAVLFTISTISVLGLDTLSVKLVPINENNLKFLYFRIILNIFPVALFFSFLLFYLSDNIALVFDKKILNEYLRILSFSIIPLSIININCEFFRGKKNMFFYSLYNRGSILMFLLGIIYIFSINKSNNQTLIYLYYFYAIIILAFVSTLHLFSKYLIHTNSKKTEKILSKNLISFESRNMLIINIIFISFQFVDVTLLGILSSSYNVGIYTILLKISSLTSLVLLGVNSISGPIISKLYNSNKIGELDYYIKLIVRISSFISLPILFIIILFSNYILSNFGDNLLLYKNALYILCLAQFINVLSGSVGLIMQMTGNEKIFRNIILFSILINIILSFIFIPKYQVLGAVYSSSISLILWNFLSVIYVKKKINIYSFLR